MSPSAKDLMSTSLLSLGPDTPLVDATRLFIDEGIHAAPVIDEEGRLVGIISTSDLLRAVEEEHDLPSAARSYFREALEFSGPDWSSAPADFQDRLSQITVSEVMQTSVVTIAETASVPQIAKTLREQQIHRVIVVRDGFPVGLISSFDLLALLEAKS